MKNKKGPNYITSPEITQGASEDVLYKNFEVEKKKDSKPKKIVKFILILIVMAIVLGVVERIVIAYSGDVYMEYVLEKVYGDTFHYEGHTGFKDYGFSCGSFPGEEICMYVDTENNSFWDYDEWEDDYLSVKYNDEANKELLDIANKVYGNGCKVEVDKLFKTQNKIKDSKNCESFEYFMQNLFEDADVNILVPIKYEDSLECTDLFIAELESKGYYIEVFEVFYFEQAIKDYSEYPYDYEIYEDAKYYDTIFLTEEFEIEEKLSCKHVMTEKQGLMWESIEE